MTTTLYGIKNCDTVKKARNWLEANGIDYQFHDFRADGISEALVNGWLQQVELEQLINKRSTTWKQLDDASKASLSNDNAAALCCQHETLVKRPVLDLNGQIHLGFNDKTYQTLFNL